MKFKFLLSILLVIILISILVEGRTALSNCIEVCTDSSGCTCPTYCTIPGNVNQNANCGGQVTGCAEENKGYWIKDGDCQATCGDYDNEFMISKGWTRVDYNCYIEEPKIEEEKEEEKIEIIEEPQDQEVKKIDSWVVPTVLVILILLVLWLIFKKRRRIRRLFLF